MNLKFKYIGKFSKLCTVGKHELKYSFVKTMQLGMILNQNCMLKSLQEINSVAENKKVSVWLGEHPIVV